MIRLIKQKHIAIFRDEDGFSSLSIVISLLVALSLIFSTAQIYRINSASADIQNVADSSALAAQTQVSEFMILVRLSDSVILSLGLSAIASMALGVVCMCTPVTASASSGFLEAAQKMIQARDNFSEKSATVLNSIQKSLPFIATAKAYQVAKSNSGGIMKAEYLSLAILMPGGGLEITPGNIDDVKNTLNEVNENSDDIKKAAADAEEAANAANQAKLDAYYADCGNNPNYCMYERAKNKAGMQGAENPLYNSPDSWSFSVALKRAQAYYPRRIEIEKPEGSSVNQQANSALRKIFYSYAASQMEHAYVYEVDDFFDANFPHLPKNTEEMRQTSMYHDSIFPISSDGVMHAYAGCPGCQSLAGYGCLEQYESSGADKCQHCKFSASSLGSVAQASSSIDNGFEYHYGIVERSAKAYKDAKDKAAPLNKKVKDFASTIFAKLKDLIKSVSSKRIYAKPPGAYGCLCITANVNSAPVDTGFKSSFVDSGESLGLRIAISSATILEEKSDDSKSMISSLLDGISNQCPVISGPAGIALSAWSKILNAYNEGQESFIEGIEDALNNVHLISASGLGTWAANFLRSLLEDLGLEPANIKSLKPVLVSSGAVANVLANDKKSDNDLAKSFAVKYVSIRKDAISFSEATNNLLLVISNGEELAKMFNVDELLYKDGYFEIAEIQPLGEYGPSIPIRIQLPKFAKSQMNDLLNHIAVCLQKVSGVIFEGKQWR